jgi:ethanolamine utilization protein EutN
VIVGRVVGPLVATQKHKKFEGSTLLLVQPLGEGDTPRGPALLAVDTVGAGIHDKVLLVLDGKAAGDAMKKKAVPVDAAIVGIVDHIEMG